MNTPCWISLGSNQGQSIILLKKTLNHLKRAPGISHIIPSPLYRTDPLGVTFQPRFINAVVKIDTLLSPHQLLKILQKIEKK
ncbi:2-amino-4-hydroxy-6-hydroxymethyldihydropteridine diphosphokinase, partial [Magnetococcales bacterium HHB-1]